MRDELSATRPNILLFTCHDLGRYHGYYGHRTVHSPALDDQPGPGGRYMQRRAVVLHRLLV